MMKYDLSRNASVERKSHGGIFKRRVVPTAKLMDFLEIERCEKFHEKMSKKDMFDIEKDPLIHYPIAQSDLEKRDSFENFKGHAKKADFYVDEFIKSKRSPFDFSSMGSNSSGMMEYGYPMSKELLLQIFTENLLRIISNTLEGIYEKYSLAKILCAEGEQDRQFQDEEMRRKEGNYSYSEMLNFFRTAKVQVDKMIGNLIEYREMHQSLLKMAWTKYYNMSVKYGEQKEQLNISALEYSKLEIKMKTTEKALCDSRVEIEKLDKEVVNLYCTWKKADEKVHLFRKRNEQAEKKCRELMDVIKILDCERRKAEETVSNTAYQLEMALGTIAAYKANTKITENHHVNAETKAHDSELRVQQLKLENEHLRHNKQKI